MMAKSVRYIVIMLVAVSAVLSAVGIHAAEDGGQYSPASASKKVLILPLINISGYNGNWDLGEGFRKLLAERFDTLVKWQPFVPSRYQLDKMRKQVVREIAPEASRTERLAKLGEKFGADYVMDNTIDTFSIRNFGIVHPSFGGYSAYSVDAGIEVFMVNVSSPENVFQQQVRTQKMSEHQIGTLFTDGHLWTKELGTMEEFDALKDMAFGSPQWRETRLGVQVMKLTDKIVSVTTGYADPVGNSAVESGIVK
ncbi:MAG: hypothetical protein WC955_04020 [Elusimicrobiota bacterium]